MSTLSAPATAGSPPARSGAARATRRSTASCCWPRPRTPASRGPTPTRMSASSLRLLRGAFRP
eukprot:15004361-Alexandrium_andersonii.AAC.1